jgi:hypothetical protein
VTVNKRQNLKCDELKVKATKYKFQENNIIHSKTGNVRVNFTPRSVGVTIFILQKQLVIHILSVSVASVVQHALRICRIIICGMSESNIHFHIIS